jgi:hypothetical protein
MSKTSKGRKDTTKWNRRQKLMVIFEPLHIVVCLSCRSLVGVNLSFNLNNLIQNMAAAAKSNASRGYFLLSELPLKLLYFNVLVFNLVY